MNYRLQEFGQRMAVPSSEKKAITVRAEDKEGIDLPIDFYLENG
jgi:hypothetical protein